MTTGELTQHRCSMYEIYLQFLLLYRIAVNDVDAFCCKRPGHRLSKRNAKLASFLAAANTRACTHTNRDKRGQMKINISLHFNQNCGKPSPLFFCVDRLMCQEHGNIWQNGSVDGGKHYNLDKVPVNFQTPTLETFNKIRRSI